jgi:uncharacterized membrane protein YgdD (TMEM256/DUF423 family)
MAARLLRGACGLSGFSAVALGAYGAHGLPDKSDYQKKVWERATTYHLAHTAAALGVLGVTGPVSSTAVASGAFFLAGNALFSGSLYALVVTEDSQFARIAPYGGGMMMLGWLTVAVAAVV